MSLSIGASNATLLTSIIQIQDDVYTYKERLHILRATCVFLDGLLGIYISISGSYRYQDSDIQEIDIQDIDVEIDIRAYIDKDIYNLSCL